MATNGASVPDPIDIHVGRRVRLRRKELGLTQEALAEQLGLTFQQVQKYERGANRVSASKLYRLATIMRVSIGYFFTGLDDPASPSGLAYERAWSSVLEELLAEPNGAALAEAFLSIRRRSVRKSLVDLLQTLVANQSEGSSDQNGFRSAAE